ncbi:MAG: hypothetical protein QM817_29030 [Archangium sp.]
MKRALLIAVLSLTFVPAEAKVACFSGDETLLLTPSGAVTLDGLILQRSATTGRFTNDAGIDFDVNGSKVAAQSMTTGCRVDATALTLTTTNPFDGPDASVLTLTVVKP